jgi:hypothetical protein
MNENDDDAIAEAGRIASEMLERSLMKAVGAVEAELARVVRTGEADIARLAGSVMEILAKVSTARDSGPIDAAGPSDAAVSLNQIAVAVARAARRGARFT